MCERVSLEFLKAKRKWGEREKILVMTLEVID